jgi:hypothetical protein
MNKAEKELVSAELRRAIVDEYGALAVELAPWKKKDARFDELAKIIRGWYVDSDGEKSFVEVGEQYQATLGVKQLATRIDVKGAWRAMGRAKFLQACSVTIKALEQFLEADQVQGLLTKERSGSRPLLTSPLISSQTQTLMNGEAIV